MDVQLPDQFLPPKAPPITLARAPIEERAAVKFVLGRLEEASRFARQFAASVALFAYSSNFDRDFSGRSLMMDWMPMGGREASMALYHLCKVMEGLHFKHIAPEFSKFVDYDKLASARKRFRTEFPSIESLRLSVAHAGELQSTPEKKERTYARESTSSDFDILEGGYLGMTDVIVGNRYQNTVNGQVVECDLSLDRVLVLNSVLQEFFDGFSNAVN